MTVTAPPCRAAPETLPADDAAMAAAAGPRPGDRKLRPVDRYGFVDAPESRRLRGRRILRALAEFGGVDVERARILDIGCSAGIMTEALTVRENVVVGIDVDVEAIRYAMARHGRARFVAASGERLPFFDESFDAVVCNHVYEHVAGAHALLREVRRVLRSGGACYFAAGHRLQVIEPHHRLPFLSWLPRSIAGAWLRALGRERRYEERFVAPWQLRGLFDQFSSAELVSAAMLRAPERFEFPGIGRLPRVVRRLVAVASEPLARLAPTWIFVLRR